MASSRFNRRVMVLGGAAVAGGAILATGGQGRQSDIRFGSGDFRSFTLEPLQVALLDRHAERLAPLLPELESLLRRRVEVNALTFEELYSNFTIDLLQQTGRYDVVSICDAWIPFFGRSGYFSNVPM